MRAMQVCMRTMVRLTGYAGCSSSRRKRAEKQAERREGRDRTLERRDEFSHFLLFYERPERFLSTGPTLYASLRDMYDGRFEEFSKQRLGMFGCHRSCVLANALLSFALGYCPFLNMYRFGFR
jgi:hypothetical protein